MPIPFPPVTGFTPYPTPARVDPHLHTSAKSAWLQTPAPANAYFFDQQTLQQRVATGLAVNTANKTLTLTAEGSSMTFDLSGDGTGRIPVGIVLA